MLQGVSNNIFNTMQGYNNVFKKDNEITKIQDKLDMGMNVEDLSEEEYQRLNAFEKSESANLEAKVLSEKSKAERIAVKIAKGEDLTEEEEKFISEKFPDLKREALEAKKYGKELEGQIRNAKTKSEKEQIIAMAVSSVAQMVKSGSASESQLKIKMAVIEKARENSMKEEQDGKGIKVSGIDVEKGTFINTIG